MRTKPLATMRGALRWGLALVVSALLWTPPAHAERYRVDLIVFLDLEASGEQGAAPQPPMQSAAIALDDAAALQAAGIRVLPDAEFGLQEHWNRLRNSRRFRPLVRLAWEQAQPPAANGPRLAIRHGEPMPVHDTLTANSFLVQPVEGSVGLLMSRYLHLDVDLRYTTADATSQYALTERRRMRRDELHHLDSPRLGLLARIRAVEETRP
ncbi:CsiV family protein [Sinimarinibacterium thermocellulolyticum]|uniref:CsiV family protein n=1 Tax=Sinimarinibacterium thermocellulolyticum TaxID=3170016 RepID=A0ABV2ABA5_9GAMM